MSQDVLNKSGIFVSTSPEICHSRSVAASFFTLGTLPSPPVCLLSTRPLAQGLAKHFVLAGDVQNEFGRSMTVDSARPREVGEGFWDMLRPWHARSVDH